MAGAEEREADLEVGLEQITTLTLLHSFTLCFILCTLVYTLGVPRPDLRVRYILYTCTLYSVLCTFYFILNVGLDHTETLKYCCILYTLCFILGALYYFIL